MSADAKNTLLLLQLLTLYASKLQEIGALFRTALIEGRDVSDEEVAKSTLQRDLALAHTQSTIDAS